MATYQAPRTSLLMSESRSPRATSFVLCTERTRPGYFPGPVLEIVAQYTADATDAWEICLDSINDLPQLLPRHHAGGGLLGAMGGGGGVWRAVSGTGGAVARLADEDGFHFRCRRSPELRIWPYTSMRGYFHAEVQGRVSNCVVWSNGVVDLAEEHDPEEYIESDRIPIAWLPIPNADEATATAKAAGSATVLDKQTAAKKRKQQQKKQKQQMKKKQAKAAQTHTLPTEGDHNNSTRAAAADEGRASDPKGVAEEEAEAEEEAPHEERKVRRSFPVAAEMGGLVVERVGDALRFMLRGAPEEETECLMLLPDGTATYLGEDWVVTFTQDGVHSTAVPKEAIRLARSRSGSSGSGSDVAASSSSRRAAVDPSAA